jgi:hypothetical protein
MLEAHPLQVEEGALFFGKIVQCVQYRNLWPALAQSRRGPSVDISVCQV